MSKNRSLILMIITADILIGWSWASMFCDFPTLRLLCFAVLGIAVRAAWFFRG